MKSVYVFYVLKAAAKRIFLFLLIFVLTLGFYISVDQARLTVSEYDYATDKTNASFKFVMIADLHNKQFGKDNERLIAKIAEQDPEFVIIAGDMVLKEEKDLSVAQKLVKQLSELCPVYYTFGNHELEVRSDYDVEYVMTQAGATVLNNKMIKYSVDGDEIIIGGLRNFPFYEQYAPKFENEERYFLEDFIGAEKDAFSLLICHYPEAYCWQLKEFDIDLMLAGHAHGGIVRIPFLGGVYVPDRGWFGGYDKGFYKTDTATMLVTTGLGVSGFIPRINNPPEICVVNVNP
ncbi:MAG: metallophosphoesterase [Clostridiales bacterium]|nr:metallophosphoesterase [Clostridiales bacterium]